MYQKAYEKEIELRHRIHKIFTSEIKHKNFPDRERYLPSDLWIHRNLDLQEPLSKLLYDNNIYRSGEYVMAYKNMSFLSKGSMRIGMTEIHVFDENISHKILETGAGYFGDYETDQTLITASIDECPIPLHAIENILSELEKCFGNLDKVAKEVKIKQNEDKGKLKNNLFAKFR